MTRCTGSGRVAHSSQDKVAVCPVCLAAVMVDQAGKIRPHEPQKVPQ